VDRPVLAMINGLVGSLVYFDPAGRISAARVVACDLLGYGRLRDVPLENMTLQTQVDHVAGQIEALNAGRVWVLAHSMGGAIAMLLADQRPELIRGMINVEGNFTLKDTFWSAKIAAMSADEWADKYRQMQGDIPGWLTQCGIEPTPQKRIEWGTHLLEHQPASTVHAVSRVIVKETSQPGYLEAVRRVVDRGLPIHLIAGEHSAAAWDVPGFVRKAAASDTVIGDAGHVMMLERPDEFCRVIDNLLQ